MSTGRMLQLAVIAAAFASLGDLLLLYHANALRPDLGLPPIGGVWLLVGGVLGAVAIPFYGLGYRAASRALDESAPGAARIVGSAGIAIGLLGGLIHALTALHIGESTPAAPGADPIASIVASGPLLPALWGIAALLLLIASVPFAWMVGRGRTTAPRGLAFANPALLTIAIGVAGLPSALLQAFLVPAAPNVAHVFFFLACTCVRLRNEPATGFYPEGGR